MQVCKVQLKTGAVRPAVLEGGLVRLLRANTLSEVLHAADPTAAAAVDESAAPLPLAEVDVLPDPLPEPELLPLPEPELLPLAEPEPEPLLEPEALPEPLVEPEAELLP